MANQFAHLLRDGERTEIGFGTYRRVGKLTLVFWIRPDNRRVAARRYSPEIRHRVWIARPQPRGFKEIHLVVAGRRIEDEARLHASPVRRIEHVPTGSELRLDIKYGPAQPLGKLRMLQHFRANHLEAVGQHVVTASQTIG